jgi:catechol 2,3-dioxygenase-like lactoylglutathione lyase family enzyme
MLSDQQVYAAIPTADLDSARRFYEDVLGFVPRESNPAGIYYDASGGTYFVLTRSSGKASGSHTQMAFRVSDIEAEVHDLQNRGVTFEETRRPRRSTASRRSRSDGPPGSAIPRATSSG